TPATYPPPLHDALPTPRALAPLEQGRHRLADVAHRPVALLEQPPRHSGFVERPPRREARAEQPRQPLAHQEIERPGRLAGRRLRSEEHTSNSSHRTISY